MVGKVGTDREPRLSRRSWLIAAGLGMGVPTIARSSDASLTADEAKARDEVMARAKEVGLVRLKLHTSPRFFALSDASESFTRQALTICEDLLTDYLEYFQGRKFAMRPPSRRLTLVVLATPKEQIRFLGDDDEPDDADPVFDPDANRLVFFDLRAGGGGYRTNRERGNTVTLCHEASLLIFENTGLLDPDADVPLAIKEGLADFLENRPPVGRWKAGAPNAGKIVRLYRSKDVPWIPIDRLLADEKAFDDPERFRDAEAESWALVDVLVRSPQRLSGFQRYLAAVNTREPGSRLDLARKHLGDLAVLDRDVRTMAGKWRDFYEKAPEFEKLRR
jgi:hypothetical protein